MRPETNSEDLLQFGDGRQFNAQKVAHFLNLAKVDVSHLASIDEAAIRYDDSIPLVVHERLQEIAATINLVAKRFDGDAEKTAAWFKTTNPMLGDVSPRDMIRLGRHDRLRRFILNALDCKAEA